WNGDCCGRRADAVTSAAEPQEGQECARVDGDALAAFCRAVLAGAGADKQTTEAVTHAMMHGSRFGIDSHGVRLLEHYVKVICGGRVNGAPRMRFAASLPATAILDADHGHGALAPHTAMARAKERARARRLVAVTIRNTSHFGPAGAYAIEAAYDDMIGMAFCNSDSFVRLHGGACRFHGTNPIAMAVPSGGARPWLLDMATSAIPYNRIRLYQSLGLALPAGVASLEDGCDTDDATEATMLAPLGGAFGFKGAGLAGVVEIFSAVLTGMKLSFELLPMSGEDISTPRGMGAFVLAIDPTAFVEKAVFEDGMRRYLEALHGSPAAADEKVLAPGDREWAELERREELGIPIDPQTEQAFRAFAEDLAIPMPALVEPGGG